MPRKARVTRDLTGDSDRLVQVRGDRVGELIRARGLSRRKVAAACGTKEQNLAPIVKGEQSRCRASLLKKLARVLRPPGGMKYLTGERDLLSGADAPAAFDVLGRLHVQSSPDVPAYELALYDLVSATRRAVKREYTEGSRVQAGLPIEGAPRFPSREVIDGVERVSRAVGPIDPREVFAPLISLENWRAFAFGDRKDDGGLQELDEKDEIEFARCMAGAIRVLMKPWFAGRRTLRRETRATGRVARLTRIGPSEDELIEIPETIADDYWFWNLLNSVGEEIKRWPAHGERILSRLEADEKGHTSTTVGVNALDDLSLDASAGSDAATTSQMPPSSSVQHKRRKPRK
jgi:transcriptional regulator with XRE-family HTH domain